MKLVLAAIAALSSASAFAQYYKTLPEGVRTLVYRNVRTSEVDSTYNNNAALSPISYNIEINTDMIGSIDDAQINGLFEYVEDVYPDGFKDLTAGAFEISGSANIEVDGFGFGYGISNRLTAYAILPFYKANVDMKYKRTKSNNFEEIANAYITETGNDQAQWIGSSFMELPDLVTGPTIQNILVENYGYSEIGTWQGEGLGDLELGLMYNFLERDNYGLKLTGGFVAPTGREDDPDILQDIPFGDGQWDAFAEFGGGIRLGKHFIINSYARYTHQFESVKQLRVPTDSDNTVSAEKGFFYEKRGNKLLFDVDADLIINDWVNFNAAYIYEEIGKTSYSSDFGMANDWLAANTNSTAHSLRFKAELSSVDAFMKNQFLLPAQVKFYYQNTLEGVNTPNVERFEVELRMFF